MVFDPYSGSGTTAHVAKELGCQFSGIEIDPELVESHTNSVQPVAVGLKSRATIKPDFSSDGIKLYHGDCAEILPSLADGSVDLICTDPPYDESPDFLDWLETVFAEWKRVLKLNGSLYVFSSPAMADEVSNRLSKYFRILNQIRWVKPNGWHKKTEKARLKKFLSSHEVIIFAEQLEYNRKTVQAETVGKYIRKAFQRAGIIEADARQLFPSRNGKPTGMVSNWISGKSLPSESQYEKLKQFLNVKMISHSQLIRRVKKGLRYFDLTKVENHSDTWVFEPVHHTRRIHESEKPVPLLKQILEVSSRENEMVLDCFMGSGSTVKACLETRRRCIGIENRQKNFRRAKCRVWP